MLYRLTMEKCKRKLVKGFYQNNKNLNHLPVGAVEPKYLTGFKIQLDNVIVRIVQHGCLQHQGTRCRGYPSVLFPKFI